VTEGKGPDQSLQYFWTEDIGDIAHPSLAMQSDTIATHDSGRLLAAVLKAVESQVGVPCGIDVTGYAEHTTLIFKFVTVDPHLNKEL
jgi:hypothetical protein